MALGQPQTRCDLATVVELRSDARDQLVCEIAYSDAMGGFDAAIELPRDHRKHSRVAPNEVVDPRPLDLDDYGSSIVEARAMGLPDRCGSERLFAERGECLLNRLTELGVQDLVNLLWPQASDVRVQA